MLVETYLRRGQRSLQRLALDPQVRRLASGIGWWGGGFLLSAGGLGSYPMPLAAGVLCALFGWRVVLMSLGAMLGYPVFWGTAGLPGVVWTAAVGLLTLLLGKREGRREQPLMLPVLAAFLTGVTELCFCVLLKDETPFLLRCARVMLTLLTAMVFLQGRSCREPVTDWLAGGFLVLAVARVRLGPLGLGPLAAGALGVGGAFPAAVVAGLALDLSQVSRLPMAAVLCLGWLLRLLPWEKRWQQMITPCAAYMLVSGALGIWEGESLPGLALGSALGLLLPEQTLPERRRGHTGAAQVHLELGARAMGEVGQLLRQTEPPPLDEQALLDRARHRACSGCPARKGCKTCDNFSLALLLDPLDADCAKQSRLLPELRRAREQRKLLKADRKRQWEYRMAMAAQYEGLSEYLRTLSDALPKGALSGQAQFRIEAGARSRGKERANGDSCIAFPGLEGCYYILLCDGMGTGLGAAQEGATASALLRQLLTAGIPAEHALTTMNSLLLLRGCAGAVTVDLCRIHLDTGLAELYKWGAAPSYLLSRQGTEKIGTASPPPGIDLEKGRRQRIKLSLRRGEVLLMLSDGVDGEDVQHLGAMSPDLPPGELAANILARCCEDHADDATVAAIRLRPTALAAS